MKGYFKRHCMPSTIKKYINSILNNKHGILVVVLVFRLLLVFTSTGAQTNNCLLPSLSRNHPELTGRAVSSSLDIYKEVEN